MAYMRGEFYIYRSGSEEGETLHFHCPNLDGSLPKDIAEDLAVMIVTRMSSDELDVAMERVSERHGGNFGAEGVQAALGKPTIMDYLKQLAHDRDG